MNTVTASLTRLHLRFGPGLLFAAAAVGTSHLVQSTRAGAAYGLTLAGLVILVCLLKYPLFRFAADYAAATGENLVRGYGRQGRALVIVMFLTSAIEAVAAVAGVSLVTAALGQWLFGTSVDPVFATGGVLLATAALVAIGRYGVLVSITGLLVAVFSLLTLTATLSSLPVLANQPSLWPAFTLTRENAAFAIAVSGWMPIGNTAAMMLAAWILARKQAGGVAAARFDFNLGYGASVLLALCFLIMGAAVLHGSATVLPGASADFVTGFVDLYARTIGDWSTAIVTLAAFAVMYSTLLAIVDGFPRFLAEFFIELRGGGADETAARALYLPALVVVISGACIVLAFFMRSFAAFIDIVTITGFLAAPIVAWANGRVVSGSNVPPEHRPGKALLRWNQFAVVLLGAATLGFLYLRWF
ncbi:MAG: hypothetical protein AAGE43_17200 [Pseudomonadota bacterium]